MSTKHNNEITFRIPSERKDEADAALEAIGLGPENFGVSISTAEGRSVAYYACTINMTDDQLKDARKVMKGIAGNKEQRKHVRQMIKDDRMHRNEKTRRSGRGKRERRRI